MSDSYRIIVLYPGESITIGDTIIKVETRGSQCVPTLIPTPADIAPSRKREDLYRVTCEGGK